MAQTLTQTGLGGLATQMPVRNKLIADQQKAARALQLQQTIAQMTPQQAPTSAQAAQLGATMAEQAGAQQVARAAQTQEQVGQIAQLGQRETALAGAAKLGAEQESLRQERLGQTERLAALDANAKKELFDQELQFKKDAANQTFFSERQLADYKKQAAASDEQFKSWASTAQNLHKRNIATLQTIYDRLAEVERNNFRIGEQKLDQAAKQEIVNLKLETEKKLRDAQRKAANTSAMWSGLGGIATAVGTGLMFVPGAQVAGAGLIATGGLATAYGQREAAKESGRI